MSAKTILLFCAQAFIIQMTLAQCTSRAAVETSGYGTPYGLNGASLAQSLTYDGLAAPCLNGPGLNAPGLATQYAFDNYATPYGYDGVSGLYAPALDITPTSGGGLTVTSASAIPPTGISVISENVYEGNLAISGQIPFVGTTGVEGVLSTAGAGAVNHACGNGVNAMVSENAAFGPEYAAALAPAANLAANPSAAFAPFAAGQFTNAAYDAAPCASGFGPSAAYGAYGRGYAL